MMNKIYTIFINSFSFFSSSPSLTTILDLIGYFFCILGVWLILGCLYHLFYSSFSAWRIRKDPYYYTKASKDRRIGLALRKVL